MGETYYEVLGVDPDATVDEIESAYRDRVLETHPDHSDDPDAAEQFNRVTTAKSVLTDETKRARYDRLGHDAYVDFAQEPAGGSASSARGERTTTTTGTGTGTTNGTAGTERGHRTGSHRARHRSQRQRKQARQQAAGDWPFEGTDGPENGRGRGERTQTGGSTAGNQESEFQYTVHDWDGDVDLEWEGPPIHRRTVVSVGLIALLYPLLVAASLTPLFSLSVNVVVAACTLAIAGYLLTMPRLAMAAFGVWSGCFPIGLVAIPWLTPVSVAGLLAMGFAWVPFGYAVALWWVLRP